MEQNKDVEIFSFENLYDVLVSEESISFDPSEEMLSFGDNLGNDATVTIRSKAAGGLFVSLVKYLFSGYYQTLSFKTSVSLERNVKSYDSGFKRSSLKKGTIRRNPASSWFCLFIVILVFFVREIDSLKQSFFIGHTSY